MSEEHTLTLESVRMVMLEIGGVCTNHDLVAKFKPLLNHPVRKLENRTKLKEFVQLLASVENKDGERVLVLKKRYAQQGCFNLLPNQLYAEQSRYGDSDRQPISQLPIPELFTSEAPIAIVPPPPPMSLATLPQQQYTSTDSQRSDYYEVAECPIATLPATLAARPVMPPPDRPSAIISDHPPVPSLNRPSVPPPDRPSAPPERSLAPVPESPTSAEDTQLMPYATESDKTSESCRSNDASSGSNSNVTDFSTPERPMNNILVNQRSPMSAKDRIKQFDQMHVREEKHEVTSNHSYRRNKENRIHSHNIGAASDLPEYDGSIAMVSLEPVEKEWMLISAGSKYMEMCRLLNSNPELAHRRDFINGFNAMHWAAKHGKAEVIKLLNSYKVDVDLRSFCGYTPVHLAAMNGNEECIDLLVNLCKAKPNTRDFYGKRPKQYLKKTCSTRIQQMLLNNSRQSFAASSTVDDMNAFARTQSFSAKIMKNNQGLAKQFSSSDDFKDLEWKRSSNNNNAESMATDSQRYDYQTGGAGAEPLYHSVNPLPASHLQAVDSNAMARSESAPDIFPESDHTQLDHPQADHTQLDHPQADHTQSPFSAYSNI